MKNVHFTSREFDLNVFVWLVLPMAAAFLGLFLLSGGFLLGLIAGPLTMAFLGLYHSFKPFGYNKRWGWGRILIFVLLVSMVALGVWWCHAEAVKGLTDPANIKSL